jgi:hypothetical protein
MRTRRSRAAGLPVLAGIAALALPCGPAATGELESLTVSEQDGVYEIHARMRLDAPAAEVFEVLTDYAHLYRLDPSITESLVLPPAADGSVRVRTRLEDCVAFVCLDVTRIERLRETGPGELHGSIEPDGSDFRSGESHWRVRAEGDSTVVHYAGRIEPAFSLPPLLGPAMMKRKLEEHTLNTFSRIECIARLRSRLAAAGPQADETDLRRCTG